MMQWQARASVLRALANAAANGDGPMSAGRINQHTRVSIETARKTLVALEDAGVVARPQGVLTLTDEGYVPGPVIAAVFGRDDRTAEVPRAIVEGLVARDRRGWVSRSTIAGVTEAALGGSQVHRALRLNAALARLTEAYLLRRRVPRGAGHVPAAWTYHLTLPSREHDLALVRGLLSVCARNEVIIGNGQADAVSWNDDSGIVAKGEFHPRVAWVHLAGDGIHLRGAPARALRLCGRAE